MDRWTAPSGGTADDGTDRPTPETPPPPAAPDWSNQQPPAAMPGYGGWGPGYGQPGGPPPNPQWMSPTPAAPKPGVVPLRPLGFGEILDGAFNTVRRYPKVTVGLSAVVYGVAGLIAIALTWLVLRPLVPASSQVQIAAGRLSEDQVLRLLSGTIPVLAVLGVLFLLVTTVLLGLMTHVVSRAVLGQTVTAGEAWQAVRGQLPRLLGLCLLLGLIQIGSVLVLVPALIVGITTENAGLAFLLAVPLTLCSVALFVYLYTLFSLAAPALVLERQGVLAALGRSARLVRGSWWRITGIIFVVGLITGMVSMLFRIPFELIGMVVALATTGAGADPLAVGSAQTAISGLGFVVAQSLTGPFTAACGVLIYVDQRMRREGLDLELARSAGLAPGAAAPDAGGQQR